MGAWASLRAIMPRSGLMFFSALLQIVLGCLMIFQPAPVMLALPFLFAFWLIFEGVNLAIGSYDIKLVGFPRWWILLCIGIIAAAFGIYCLVNPNVSVEAIAWIVGVGIILDGVGNWVKVILVSKVENRLTQLGDRFQAAVKEIEDAKWEEVK